MALGTKILAAAAAGLAVVGFGGGVLYARSTERFDPHCMMTGYADGQPPHADRNTAVFHFEPVGTPGGLWIECLHHVPKD